jgi:integrase
MGVKVREKPKGSGVWWVFIQHNYIRKSKRIGDQKTAQVVAEKLNAKLVLGELNVEKINESLPTFKELATIWLSLPHDWKESTAESYQNNLEKHIYPVFGNLNIDKIGRRDLKEFFHGLLANGKASSTVSLIRAPINGVLSHAVDSELIEMNPVYGLKLPRRKSTLEVEPLSEIEAKKLLDHAKLYLGGLYYPTFLCALRTGMRLGEMKALKWQDIDFKKRLIEVKRSCRRGRITDTKNHKRRRVDMTPLLAKTLKQLETAQKKAALKRGQPVPEWVFANKRGEIFIRVPFENALNQCLKAAGLRRIRIHDLRHTYATIRLLRGHNVGDVSYQLGHSSIKMTYDVYTHWMPGKFKNEVDDLDNPHLNAPYTHPVDEAGQIL